MGYDLQPGFLASLLCGKWKTSRFQVPPDFFFHVRSTSQASIFANLPSNASSFSFSVRLKSTRGGA
jgi:hypothetical protein